MRLITHTAYFCNYFVNLILLEIGAAKLLAERYELKFAFLCLFLSKNVIKSYEIQTQQFIVMIKRVC